MTTNLNYEGFEEYLLFKNEENIGEYYERVHYVFRFKNDYGASVVKGRGTYGYNEDLWELAVLSFDNRSDEYYLDYDTPITNDVLGHLTDDEVGDLLARIKEL